MAFQKLFSAYIIIFICFNSKIMAKQNHRSFYIDGQDLSGDIMGYGNFYNNEKKYQTDDEQNFLGRWPWLRDLLPPRIVDTSGGGANGETNYDVNPVLVGIDRKTTNDIQTGGYGSNENVYGKAKELSAEPMPIPVAFTDRRNMIKERDEKRQNNNYYMSLCHFKICNMGRKRNTRYLHYWNFMDRNTYFNKAAM